MKKVLLSFVLCCISIVGMAQTDVTKFLGIPVDGNKSDMMRKLKSKGFTQSPYAEGVLTGKFNGVDVNVHIVTNNDKVCRIMVCDANTMDEASIRIRFNVLCKQFKVLQFIRGRPETQRGRGYLIRNDCPQKTI